MIAEYKLYHGAVLAEIIDNAGRDLSIEAVFESGRLLNYRVAGRVGLQIKYCTQKLRPWPFTFTRSHILDLKNLSWLPAAYLVLVCRTDGIITVPAVDALRLLQTDADAPQSWLRADRRKREQYRLSGPNGEYPTKVPSGVDAILQAVDQTRE